MTPLRRDDGIEFGGFVISSGISNYAVDGDDGVGSWAFHSVWRIYFANQSVRRQLIYWDSLGIHDRATIE